MVNEVLLAPRAVKQLRKIPRHVIQKLLEWVDAVEMLGLHEVRKVPGYHDEPLRGQRAGQRSIRLSRAYRAIYVVTIRGNVELVQVEEVSKHDY